MLSRRIETIRGALGIGERLHVPRPRPATEADIVAAPKLIRLFGNDSPVSVQHVPDPRATIWNGERRIDRTLQLRFQKPKPAEEQTPEFGRTNTDFLYEDHYVSESEIREAQAWFEVYRPRYLITDFPTWRALDEIADFELIAVNLSLVVKVLETELVLFDPRTI